MSLLSRLRPHRTVLSRVFDLVVWLAAYGGFALLRYQATSAAIPWFALALLAVLTWVLFCLMGAVVHLHDGRARTGSIDELALLGGVVAWAGGATFLLNLVRVDVPRTVPVGAAFLALIGAGWGRAVWRRLQERSWEGLRDADGRRCLVVGAGDAGRELILSMHRDLDGTWYPCGLLDDDPMKRHRRIRRVPVVGTTAQMGDLARQLDVRTVILALPSAGRETISRLSEQARAEGLDVKVLPAATELIGQQVDIQDIRDIDLKDVLGRSQLDTDIDAIAHYLTGRVVLVTGAGGSIGSELCRQISQYDPLQLIMLDRDESALHAVQLSLSGRALLDDDGVVLCDIRDGEAVRALFLERRPEVVFHAAALKHLPMLEQYPAEAVKTNVIGTRNVLDACAAAGVTRFVNISTDKAANPTSVLGYSKRVAECLTAERARAADGTYLSVRFGNVLGSRGSVLLAFASQIARGGPVTVTHPEVTRYFMTIEEACQLVVQAAAIGEAGEALVLDMGDPVSILAVAERLIDQSGKEIAIEFTGLREGEKLHEELFGDAEPRDHKPRHELVSHVPVPPIGSDAVAGLPTTGSSLGVREALAHLCSEADQRLAANKRLS